MTAAGSTACFQQRPSVANILRHFRENGRVERTLDADGWHCLFDCGKPFRNHGIQSEVRGSPATGLSDSGDLCFFLTLGILNLLKD